MFQRTFKIILFFPPLFWPCLSEIKNSKINHQKLNAKHLWYYFKHGLKKIKFTFNCSHLTSSYVIAYSYKLKRKKKPQNTTMLIHYKLLKQKANSLHSSNLIRKSVEKEFYFEIIEIYACHVYITLGIFKLVTSISTRHKLLGKYFIFLSQIVLLRNLMS